ncbi:hypothetical protein K432DRAFT_35383, partial [Lepidopterella palustris CBS 459.81]
MSSSLRRDICTLHAPGTLTSTIDRSRVDYFLPKELQNECRFWVQHLQRGQTHFLVDMQLQVQVYTFLKEYFLYWLEALSLMSKPTGSIRALISLEDLINEFPVHQELRDIVYDAKRFALRNVWIIEHAPLQLYYSALCFAPSASVVRRHFQREMSARICSGVDIRESWGALLVTLEGHLNSVNAVAFSPDGKLV